MTTAYNPSQVGGNHYQAKNGGVEHWDYCTVVNAPYRESAATKYLTRWRNKNGLQDLQKAASYVEKRLQSLTRGEGAIRGAARHRALFTAYLRDCEVPTTESIIIDTLLHWRNAAHLEAALRDIKNLIAECEAGEPGPGYVNQDR